MKFRAICTDIDGTLLNSQRELSTRTIAAVKSLDSHIPVILASSRMPSAMRHLQEELGILHHPMICFNGGYVIIFESEATTPVVIDTVHIPASVALAIMELAKGTNLHISLYAEDQWYAPQQDQWAEREARVTKVSPSITSLNTVLDEWHAAQSGAHKVMCMGPEHEIDAMQAALTKNFSTQLHIYRSKNTYLEIAPRAISKATALELILKHQFDIPMSEVIAFGDNYNDIDMLKAVGKGIAVGNAKEEVKAVADEITLNSYDDGVAISIEKYFG
ncbi:Cof-type HAD-IIB family hydrolase [Pontibacter silvestris]|uniref:Cof-type HAD-IIB family hydrolase n=1 Tax=Pontibacter silvestris TaxID=2305183 RepID=A0ABW4WX92_9BACT|nr:Cof-type HAD-IIB family hydrolase [Pontibacter silvestris]MCC9136459.1 Cof-type HAD-IIB family hydrolase [Pontibacter silvestris]